MTKRSANQRLSDWQASRSSAASSRVQDWSRASARALGSEQHGVGRGVSSDPAQLQRGAEQNTAAGNSAMHPDGDADFKIVRGSKSVAERRSNPVADIGAIDVNKSLDATLRATKQRHGDAALAADSHRQVKP